MNLQESIRRILREESKNTSLQDKVLYILKSKGVELASKAVGGFKNLFKILDINSPMDYLHLFDDLDYVESEETQGLFLFRYEKGKNVMVFEESDNGIYVYINYDIIFGPLANFRETVRYDEKMQTIKRWLTREYGVETKNIIHIDSFHPGSEEFGVYETLI